MSDPPAPCNVCSHDERLCSAHQPALTPDECAAIARRLNYAGVYWEAEAMRRMLATIDQLRSSLARVTAERERAQWHAEELSLELGRVTAERDEARENVQAACEAANGLLAQVRRERDEARAVIREATSGDSCCRFCDRDLAQGDGEIPHNADCRLAAQIRPSTE